MVRDKMPACSARDLASAARVTLLYRRVRCARQFATGRARAQAETTAKRSPAAHMARTAVAQRSGKLASAAQALDLLHSQHSVRAPSGGRNKRDCARGLNISVQHGLILQ